MYSIMDSIITRSTYRSLLFKDDYYDKAVYLLSMLNFQKQLSIQWHAHLFCYIFSPFLNINAKK